MRGNAIGALCCLVALGGSIPMATAAEATGQQRAQSAARALLGTPGPRRAMTTIDGDVIDLGSLYGKKAVYLKFWATWCVPCREQMPHFQHASGDVFRTFRVNEVPTVLIADTRGRIVRRIEASSAQDAAALRAAVDGARRE